MPDLVSGTAGVGRVDSATAARRRERLAWRVVLGSFAAFCLLAASLPLGIRQYVASATSAQATRLEIIRGTVLLLQAGSRQEIGAASGVELAEGDQVRTTSDSQALISLFDGSNLRLWPETTLRVERVRASRYNSATTEVTLYQKSGYARIEVAPPITKSRQLDLRTPQGTARLREGSYAAQVADLQTELSARRGSASVTADGQTLEILSGERTTVVKGQPPSQPKPAATNYVVNGDFTGALSGWQAGNRAVEDGVQGEIRLIEQDNRSIIRFLRLNSSRHAETYIHQAIDRDVSDLESLRIALQLKLVRQTLSGGGYLGSEYPLAIRVRYRDAYGSETTWVHGFYMQNAEGRPTTNGQQVEPGVWLSFAADLFDPNQVNPRPAQVLWLELEASGWQYESMVTGIQLVGQ